MNVTKEDLLGIVILRCEGRLDATTAPRLEDEINTLLDQERIKIMIDFTRIDYLSSAGMRLLLSMTKRLKAKKGKLSIFALHDEVSEIIHMAGFEKVLAIYPNQEEATRAHDEKMMG
ncbi:MAG: STAS domain-containing protein [Chlamydiae bacterium]|nr:STAS domain-containing protein [Chlamydiota bacterium]